MIPDEGRTIAYVFTAKRVGHGVKLSTSLEDIVYSRIGSAAATSAAVARATAVAGSATEVAARELIVLLLLSISIVFSVQRVEMKQTLGSISAGACALCEDRSHYSQMPLECVALLVG